jgi:hypothetical protein
VALLARRRNSPEDNTMGREAVCTCDWAGEVTEVKALLETSEIILRGGIRKRIPFSELQHVNVISDRLCFKAGDEKVELILGSPIAEKWAAVLTSQPTPLSKKLGITSNTVVQAMGNSDDEKLNAALAEAAQIATRNADLIVACVDRPESLDAALNKALKQLLRGTPIWFVYPKGPGLPLKESAIRTLLRSHGMMDTKVASVSDKLTAIRFNLRKSE